MMQSNAFEQIERADPLVETVLQKITDAIVTGRLGPGDQLVETRLGARLGVSRGPVREALRQLEQMGMVEKIPYRGAFVSTLTGRDIQELHSVREPLEGLAARLVAMQHDDDAIATLEGLLNDMRQVAADGDQSRIVKLDVDLHDALIELSAHKLLKEVWIPVSMRLRRFVLLKRRRLYASLEEAVRLHEPIVRAIAQADPDRAEAEARRHVLAAAQHFLNNLDSWTIIEHKVAEPEVPV